MHTCAVQRETKLGGYAACKALDQEIRKTAAATAAAEGTGMPTLTQQLFDLLNRTQINLNVYRVASGLTEQELDGSAGMCANK